MANLPSGPSDVYYYVTPSEDELPPRQRPRAFYFASCGALEVTNSAGVKVSFDNVPAGAVLPISAVIIHKAPAGTVMLL